MAFLSRNERSIVRSASDFRVVLRWVAGTLALSCAAALMASSSAEAASGDLDSSFGDGGRVVTRFSDQESMEVWDTRIDNQGRMLVSGRMNLISSKGGSSLYLSVLRYLPDGSLDASFGKEGRALFSLGSIMGRHIRILQEPLTGKLILVASTAPKRYYKFTAIRIDSRGNLDSSFGEGGKAYVSFDQNSSAFVEGAALDSKGRIVLGGYAQVNSGIAVARLLNDGRIDTSFGKSGTGKALYGQLGANSGISDLVLDDQERIVATGAYLNPDPSHRDCFVTRFRADGSIDSSFASSGFAKWSLGETDLAATILIDKSNRILVGSNGGPYLYGLETMGQAYLSLARLDSDGRFDSSFGTGGLVKVTNPSPETVSDHQSLAIDSQDRVVVQAAGYLFRFTGASGAVDSSFGSGGLIKTDQKSMELYGDRILEIGTRFRSIPSLSTRGVNDFLLTRRVP